MEVITNDPFQLKQTKQLVIRDNSKQVTASLASETTTYNLFKAPELIELGSAAGGNIQTQMHYDGLGRKQKVITPLGHETSVEVYDIFNRIQKAKSPDGQIYDLLYAEFSLKKLITGLEIDEGGNLTSLGEQEFDGIERVTSKGFAGVKTLYSYQGGNKLPHQIVTQAGNSIQFEFESALNNLPTSIVSWRGTDSFSPEVAETSNTFTYATKSDATPCGNLTAAQGTKGSYSFEYSPSGKIGQVTQNVDNGQTATTTSDEQTLQGKTLAATLKIGDEETKFSYTYDSFGRLLTTTQNNIVVEITYDEFGRIATEKITENGTTQQLTEVTWDDLNREQTRKITAYLASMQQVCQLDFSYDSENKLTERSTTLDGALKLKEQFTYDLCNRLTGYQVADGYDAAFLPQNEQGLGIKKQEFSFDLFYNIISIITEFDGGEVDTATFQYEEAQHRRPSKISHSLTSYFPPEVSFDYDQDGNLTYILESREVLPPRPSPTTPKVPPLASRTCKFPPRH